MVLVVFLTVKTNGDKIAAVCRTAQHHYDKRDKILITIPNEQAAAYLDLMLWKTPTESFLPHVISKAACKDPIVITELEQNLNQAHILINLRPEIPGFINAFHLIYELYDETHPDKEQLSLKKQKEYQSKNFQLTRV